MQNDEKNSSKKRDALAAKVVYRTETQIKRRPGASGAGGVSPRKTVTAVKSGVYALAALADTDKKTYGEAVECCRDNRYSHGSRLASMSDGKSIRLGGTPRPIFIAAK